MAVTAVPRTCKCLFLVLRCCQLQESYNRRGVVVEHASTSDLYGAHGGSFACNVVPICCASADSIGAGCYSSGTAMRFANPKWLKGARSLEAAVAGESIGHEGVLHSDIHVVFLGSHEIALIRFAVEGCVLVLPPENC